MSLRVFKRFYLDATGARGRWIRAAAWAGLLVVACGAPLGIVSPEAVGQRYLKLWNRSRGYVVMRVSVPGQPPVVTDVLPPGGEYNAEMATLFGTLCPPSLTVDIFGYARANPTTSALADETLAAAPYAAIRAELWPVRDYGCRADVERLSLNESLTVRVWEVDEADAAIGFSAGWRPIHRQVGLQIDDPPRPNPPQNFPLLGRVVNLDQEPVPGAQIRLGDLGESVWTDADGRFSIPRPEGAYLLEAIVPGEQVSPGPWRISHRSEDDVPVEFVVLTHEVPAPTEGGSRHDVTAEEQHAA